MKKDILKTSIFILNLFFLTCLYPQKKKKQQNNATYKIFKRLDTDHDGVISKDEAKKAKKSLIYADFQLIDTDKSQTITLKELKIISGESIEESEE